MIPRILTVFFALFFTIQCQEPIVHNETEVKPAAFFGDSSIHVFVALCDNINQRIVPVPEKIGNGQDPHNNLYWGCGNGVRTYFKNSSEWEMVLKTKPQQAEILERCVFRHRTRPVYLIADAYDGAEIKTCTHDFLMACSGAKKDTLVIGNIQIPIHGNSRLLAYTGHNGLLEFEMDQDYPRQDSLERKAIVLACSSKDWFAPYLEQSGAKPQVWTSSAMAPEAYSLEAAIAVWINNGDGRDMRKAAAAAYSTFQNCNLSAAQHLFDHYE